MNLINELVPYTLKLFITDNIFSLIFATIGLIILIIVLTRFLKLLKECKYHGIRYNGDIPELPNNYHSIRDKKYDSIMILKYKITRFNAHMFYNMITIFVLFLPILDNLYIACSHNFAKENPVTLSQLKEYIRVKDDKLTIDPLPDQYHYKILNSNESHDFKIIKDEFYRDINPKLVDKNGNRYEITNDELDKLQQ